MYFLGVPQHLQFPAEIEAQEIRSPLTNVSWRIASGPASGMTEAFVLVAGSGTVIRDHDEPTAIATPCIIWLPPGHTAEVRLGAGARGVRLRVAGAVLARVLPMTGTRPELHVVLSRPLLGLPVTAETARRLIAAISEIARELTDDLPASREACLAHLQVLAILLLRLVAPEPAEAVASPQMLVQNFMHLVELNVRRHWRLADYARTLGVSADRLVTAVDRATGATPTEIIHHRLLEDARQLLASSPLQVAEIAVALGFRDPGYFSRFFTRHSGIAPSRYRAQHASQRRPTSGSYAAWP